MSLDRIPALYTGKWPRDLAWGVDSAIASVRMLLAGQIVGAATIARQQLEHWTIVLARVVGVSQNSAASTTEFIARSWTNFAELSDLPVGRTMPSGEPERFADVDEAVESGEPTEFHKHIFLSDETEICPSVVYMVLSEIIHARECHELTTWESRFLLDPNRIPEDWRLSVAVVADAISLCLIQVGMLTGVGLYRKGERSRAVTLARYKDLPQRYSERDPAADAREWWTPGRVRGKAVPRTQRPAVAVSPVLASLMPLNPLEGLQSDIKRYLRNRHWAYWGMHFGDRPAGRLFRDDEMTTLVFDAHRYNAVRFADIALREEAEHFGDSFKDRSLSGRGTTYVLVSELAAVASIWAEGTVSAALKLVSSSLRSGYWLWLEDDDRAMACLRCTLEQSARIVATLKNPRRAEKFEANVNNPGRWLELAGWKRLNVLNKTLGEYLHAQNKVESADLRSALSDLQMNLESDAEPTMTARGHALDLVTEFAARAVVKSIRTTSAKIADTAVELLSERMDLSDERAELVLNHAWGLKSPPKTIPTSAGTQ
ncbi:hypothetical protein [Nocardia abscessus]|uniref:hypothetical protein n=1 Tax=Nocardia abscessus TaxID=120957 RepID=UPI0024574109|nr:hypothetical protein [Nocardia abscessus]